MTTPKKNSKAGQDAPPPDEVRVNVMAVVKRNPGALSYDPTEQDNDLLHCRCLTDPGIPAQLRDGWRGAIVHWAVVPYDYPDEETGELVTYPTLALISAAGELIRLANWPAINSWAAIVRAVGPDRCRAGLPVIVRRRPSGTVGRSYWSVQVDYTAADRGTGIQ
jgi:hypothetical protein